MGYYGWRSVVRRGRFTGTVEERSIGVGEDYEDFLRWIERDGASFNSDLEGSYLELRIEYSQLHDKLFTIWSLHRFRLSRWESNF